MNPNFLNLFMKKLTRERVVPRESLSTISDGLNQQTVLARFLPVPLSFLRIRRVDGESSLGGTSVGVDTTSGDLAVRVLRNPVVGGPCSSVAVGSSRRSASALWTDAEWPGDRRQRRNDASCRIALHATSREPDVAGCDIENAAVISSRPSSAGTVQRRRSRDALRGHPHCCDLPTSSPEDGGRPDLQTAGMDSPRHDRSCDLP